MNAFTRPLRLPALVVLALAAWACSPEKAPDGQTCLNPSPVPIPKTACDSSKDVYTQCPLPATVNVPNDNGEEITSYYFSDPACQSGVCTYCVTSITGTDPCATSLSTDCE